MTGVKIYVHITAVSSVVTNQSIYAEGPTDALRRKWLGEELWTPECADMTMTELGQRLFKTPVSPQHCMMCLRLQRTLAWMQHCNTRFSGYTLQVCMRQRVLDHAGSACVSLIVNTES